MLYEIRDLILVAKTSFGKSLIMQQILELPCLVDVPRSMIQIPITALAGIRARGEGQVRRLSLFMEIMLIPERCREGKVHTHSILH
jgi:hypothetical protein